MADCGGLIICCKTARWREIFPVLSEFSFLGAEKQITYCISVLIENAVLKWKQVKDLKVKVSKERKKQLLSVLREDGLKILLFGRNLFKYMEMSVEVGIETGMDKMSTIPKCMHECGW